MNPPPLTYINSCEASDCMKQSPCSYIKFSNSVIIVDNDSTRDNVDDVQTMYNIVKGFQHYGYSKVQKNGSKNTYIPCVNMQNSSTMVTTMTTTMTMTMTNSRRCQW